ncbi:MAG TPA: FtsQ-type POTRA domain-containing protein [Acidimicrobiales bacterium]
MSPSTTPIPPPADELSSIDPRIRQRRADIQRSQGRRRLRWIIAVVAALSLVAAIVGLLHTPMFSARVVTVTGAHPHTSSAAIVAAAGLDHHPPLISTDPGATARRVEALPFIAGAEVHRHWPDGVQIAVTERVPVVQMAGPGASWSTLDGHGRTLQVGPVPVPGLTVLVVHTARGVVAPAPVGGSTPPEAGPALAVSRTLPPAFASQVRSVSMAPDGSIGLALDSGITVLLGTGTDLPTKYEDVAAILAHASLHPTSTIDVTVPQSPTVSG